MKPTPTEWFRDMAAAQRAGRTIGMTAVCSANRFVLAAAMRQARADETVLCVESTASQVNPDGGYTGMTPAGFVAFVGEIARATGFPPGRILFGGDHLGPGPWRDRPAAEAMEKARVLVRDCVRAGYRKIHLDTAMALGGDRTAGAGDLPVETAARRTARLCENAERVAATAGGGDPPPVYVVGTDVPAAGGRRGDRRPAAVTTLGDLMESLDALRRNFLTRDLEAAWKRTAAVVVRSGAEFDASAATPYRSADARELAHHFETHPRRVFEAHSTDYQTRPALTRMVADHFAVLKVGPELTFALREALFALSAVEEAWLAGRRGVTTSRLPAVMYAAMRRDPVHWRDYHEGSGDRLRKKLLYSLSDRIRYYWPRPEPRAAVRRLFRNLSGGRMPQSLLDRFLPDQCERVRAGSLRADPGELVLDRIGAVAARYAAACRSDALYRPPA